MRFRLNVDNPRLVLLVGILFLISVSRAISVETLYTFPTSAPGGWVPAGKLTEVNGELYGTTTRGGQNDLGTVYRVWKTGQFMTTLHSFNGTNGSAPLAGLTHGKDGYLYGTTSGGGASQAGTLFRISPAGAFTSLFSFSNSVGRTPAASLMEGNDGVFYGTTSSGGAANLGTVFRYTSNGTLTTLASFTGANGSQPRAKLVLAADGWIYGITTFGGPGFTGPNTGGGAAFRIATNGGLVSFFLFSTNSGALPRGDFVITSEGDLVGTTSIGGAYGRGTIYKINSNGVFTTLVHFNGTNGANPYSGLVQTRDGHFYGCTTYRFLSAPSPDYGTVFRLSSNGEFTSLWQFNGTNGIHPFPELMQGSDGRLYGGAADVTGSYVVNGGTLFRFDEAPTIRSLVVGPAEVGLTWSSFSNRLYRVDYCDALGSEWHVLAPSVFSLGDTTSHFAIMPAPAQRYFRVVPLE
jgi:uncharacterized repeat protein (TIGR03803 family)